MIGSVGKEETEEKPHLLGAPNKCNDSHKLILKRIIGEIESSELMTIPLIYNENIVECYYQLVNLHFIQSILKIDGVECKMYFVQDVTGNLKVSDKHATKETEFIMTQNRLLNDRLKDFDKLDDCGRVFQTKKYMSRVLDAKNY